MVAQCNQTWLARVVRSRALHMIVTSAAASVLEVEPELQGDLVLVLDPLSLAPGASGLATSSFAVWRRAPVSLEDPEDTGAVLRPGDQLEVGGLAVFGPQTRVILAGRGGVSEYIMDRRLGGLVTSPPQPPPSDPRPLISSLPKSSESKLDPEAAELLARATSRLSSSISDVVTSRTGLAGVDSLGVMAQGGLWLSDANLGLLYHAVPLALIGQ